jgi:hypothetical protein
VYDMYPWDSDSPEGRSSAVARATDAVQIALDRRDNGGDPGTPPAGPTRQ